MIPNRMSNRSSDYISYHKKRDYERRIPKDRNEAERRSSEQLAPFFTGILIVKSFTLQTKAVVFPSIIRDENCF